MSAILRRPLSAAITALCRHRPQIAHFGTDNGAAPATTTKQNIGGPAESVLLDKLRLSFQNDVTAGKVVPVYKRALLYGHQPAIKDDKGEYSYIQLYAAAKKLSLQLSNLCGSGSSSKVAILTTNTALYTVMQWACWFSGQIVVPLSAKHPNALLEYYLSDSRAKCLITDATLEPNVQPLADTMAQPLIVIDHSIIPTTSDASASTPIDQLVAAEIALQAGDRLYIEATQENDFYARSAAMVLYTSGSTGPPKGTVISHRNLSAQTASLCSAWQITASDSLLHVLPLNHIHGCVNGLLMPLSVGAKVVAHSRFDSADVWAALLNVDQPSKDRISVFMAVPTIYALLIAEYDKVFAGNARMVDFIRSQCEKRIRLMVSGSAPLPGGVFQRWNAITGHKLLERYGMTEIGMALSNPYHVDRVRERRAGRVGVPLPGAEVKLVGADGQTVVYVKGEEERGWWSAKHGVPEYVKTAEDGESVDLVGELHVRGPGVFAEYLDRPEETRQAFANGWFRTGDEARYDGGSFQILGRKSVDIIKTGGYKVSALEVETRMLDHPSVRDVCVLGVPDVTWGQRVAAVVQMAPRNDADGSKADDDDAAMVMNGDVQLERQTTLQAFCREHLATYQVPVEFRWVKELPRNAMGKVNKRMILAEMFGVGTAGEAEGVQTKAALLSAEDAMK